MQDQSGTAFDPDAEPRLPAHLRKYMTDQLTPSGITALFVHLATHDDSQPGGQELRDRVLPGWETGLRVPVKSGPLLPGLTLETAFVWPSPRAEYMCVEYAPGVRARLDAVINYRPVHFSFPLGERRYGYVIMHIIRSVRRTYEDYIMRPNQSEAPQP